MKTNLAHWAKAHPVAARWLIALGHVVKSLMAILVGILLFSLGFEAPKALFFVAAGAFVVFSMAYPTRRECATRAEFNARRGWLDFAVLTAGVLAIVVLADRAAQGGDFPTNETSQTLETRLRHVTAPASLLVVSTAQPVSFAAETISKGRFLTRWVEKTIAQVSKKWKAAEPNEGLQFLFMVLLILGIIAVEYLLAGIACNLSCNGMDGLAALVAFGGLAGVTALTAWAMRGIFPNLRRGARIGLAIGLAVLPPLLLLLISYAFE